MEQRTAKRIDTVPLMHACDLPEAQRNDMKTGALLLRERARIEGIEPGHI